MRLKKGGIVALAGIIFLLFCLSVQAVIDSSGDVYHYNGYGAEVLWEFYGEKDTIDITDISQSTSGSDITLSLTIKGGITDNQKISYNLYLYKNPTSYYAVDYSNGSGMASGNGDLAGFIETDPAFSISADGTTLSYTFSDVDTSISYTLEAYAVEHDEYGAVAGEAWYDYAPETKAPYYSGGNGKSAGKDTPGFETLTVLAAMGIAFILLRRK